MIPAYRIQSALQKFEVWLDRFGELSQDHQDFYASRWGRNAKALYYRRPALGKFAVLPMVACEAFFPWTRPAFHPKMRLPIADAHFAMGFAYLYEQSRARRHLDRAIHFLEVLQQTRCPSYERHAWGYPFDWQTRGGVILRGTPLITTTPYCFEAFQTIHQIDSNPSWREIMRSTAEHVLLDYKDIPSGPGASTCTYTPAGGEWVVNASAYRAWTLFSAAREFGDSRYSAAAEQNLNFVLACQLEDGSWPYAVDGARPFVDHFHTCFVMKALAKIEAITSHEGCRHSLERGVNFYANHLFDTDGLPRPFARAPRLTVYRRELYDCAECINLGVLLRGRFAQLDRLVDLTVAEILDGWQLRSGSFRSRKLLLGWDNVPMHRWGQSEIFRSLALYGRDVIGADSATRRKQSASAAA